MKLQQKRWLRLALPQRSHVLGIARRRQMRERPSGPGRRLEDLRGLFGNPNLHVRDPEPPIKLGEWIAQQTGVFRIFRIWP